MGRNRLLDSADPIYNRASPIPERAIGLAEAFVSQRLQCCVVELLRSRNVADANRDMIDHNLFLQVETRVTKNSACSQYVLPPSSDRSPSHRNELGVMSVNVQRIG